jgi:hypothetical protein
MAARLTARAPAAGGHSHLFAPMARRDPPRQISARQASDYRRQRRRPPSAAASFCRFIPLPPGRPPRKPAVPLMRLVCIGHTWGRWDAPRWAVCPDLSPDFEPVRARLRIINSSAYAFRSSDQPREPRKRRRRKCCLRRQHFMQMLNATII